MQEIIRQALITALNGEHSAVQKYSEFAQKAEEEGFPNVAYLFRALVYAEKIHIKNHSNALKEEIFPEIEPYEVQSTKENILHAYNGEMHETKHMYPELRKKIKKNLKSKEGKVAALSMEWAEEVELTHAEMLEKALDAVKKGQDPDFQEIYVCRVCGNMRLIQTDEVCPVCGHDAKFYELIVKNGE